MLLIFDGPEKAGKSTLIAALAKRLEADGKIVGVRHWGKVSSDEDYVNDLFGDLRYSLNTSNHVMIWDRCWPSEYVYGRLLARRNHRMSIYPRLGSLYYERLVRALGGQLHMIIPDYDTSAMLRDATDLNVDPAEEIGLYAQYAMLNKWQAHYNNFTAYTLNRLVDQIVLQTRHYITPRYSMEQLINYPSQTPTFTFVESIHKQCPAQGPLPFAHPYGLKLYTYVQNSLNIGAVFANTGASESLLSKSKVLVAVGDRAFSELFERASAGDWHVDICAASEIEEMFDATGAITEGAKNDIKRYYGKFLAKNI